MRSEVIILLGLNVYTICPHLVARMRLAIYTRAMIESLLLILHIAGLYASALFT